MDQIIQDISKHEYKNREAYTEDTKTFLNQIKEIDENKRKDEVIKLLVKLYDDLMKSIEIGEKSSGAINDDAIEGILAIADICIEEQYEKKKHRHNKQEKDFKLEKDLYSILDDNNYKNLDKDEIVYKDKARVNAFYSLCTKHRRLKEYVEFKELVHGSYGNVNENVIFKIMKAYYFIQETANDFDPKEALRRWKDEIAPIYKRLPAFTQIYTESVALLYETSDEQESSLLKESEDLIKKAIKMRDYAKFYSTLGRIYCCKGEYDKGITEVRRAIEAEDSYREDYMSRINEYETLISRFQRKKDEKELKGIRAEMDKSKKDYVSILGFFSAVMALIIGFINVDIGQRPIIDSLQLLMGIAGMIIMSFGSLNLMLVRKDEKRTNKYPDWMLIVIGGFVFVLSFLARVVYKYLETNNWI